MNDLLYHINTAQHKNQIENSIPLLISFKDCEYRDSIFIIEQADQYYITLRKTKKISKNLAEEILNMRTGNKILNTREELEEEAISNMKYDDFYNRYYNYLEGV